MAETQPRRSFQTLDGLRAIGALLVVMRHVPMFFGPVRVPESFLAVDLFYLVSGFVVAHAYGARLHAGGFVWTFVKTRIVRLYPLYLFGLGLGVIAALVSIFGDPEGWWTPGKLVEALATGFIMFPLLPGIAANGSSLDGPTWTLLPELVANFVYALSVRFLNLWALVAIILVSGAGVIFAEFHYGTLDVGYGATQLWAALARVGFSFFTGVLVFRLFGQTEIKSTWVAWALVAILTVGLAYNPSEAATPLYELGVVLLGFPSLLILAARFEPNAFTGRLFSVTGLASYGVYILHQPLGNLVRDALKDRVTVPTDASGLIYGAAFLIMVGGLAWWLDNHYDAPVRRWLRPRLIGGSK